MAAAAICTSCATVARNSSASASNGATQLQSLREQTADQQVMQVLNRLAFGPRPGDPARVRAMGVDAWIDQQLHPERINDGAMDELLAGYPALHSDQSKLAAQYTLAVAQKRQVKRDTTMLNANQAAEVDDLKQARQSRAQLVSELESERVARAVVSNRQLLEVLTDFWENHFNVFVGKNQIEPFYLADYDRTIRDHALGKFRDLLGAVAHSPAMLAYLDNAQSRANPGEPTLSSSGRGSPLRVQAGLTPANVEILIRRRNLNDQQASQLRKRAAAAKKSGLNENYGRELMELHTLGVDGGYTQQDVIEGARALTGWTIRPPAQGGGFIFRPEWHDAGAKIFLGHTIAAGGGEGDGEQVLDILAKSPATARFISLELARRLVADSPSTALVERAAATYVKTDGNIREVVRTIVTSPEFFSARAYHSKVKSPFEVVVSAARALGAEADTSPRTALAIAYLGQPVFGHRDPNGWPETGDSWMNTGAILNRINFGLAVGANRLPGADIHALPAIDALDGKPRAVQVDGIVANLLGGQASPETRQILMSGEHPLAASAAVHAANTSSMRDSSGSAMNGVITTTSPRANGANRAVAKQQGLQGVARGSARKAVMGPVPQLTGLAQLIGFAIGSPEFQRR
ncbi:MAG: DUF1800 domain-containing protein [Gemmatimonadaceae bacterium]